MVIPELLIGIKQQVLYFYKYKSYYPQNLDYIERIFWIALLLQWSLLEKKEVFLGVFGAIYKSQKWN